MKRPLAVAASAHTLRWVALLGCLVVASRPAQAQLPGRLAAAQDSIGRLLRTNSQPDTAFINRLNRLAYNLRVNGRDVRQRRQLAKLALRLARQQAYQHGILNAQLNLGYYYRGNNKYDSALYYTRQALGLARQLRSDADRARGLYNLVHIYVEQGDYATALTVNLEGLALAQASHNRKAEMFQIIQSGAIDMALGDYAAARTHFDQALRIAQSIQDYIGMGNAYNGLGNLNRQLLRWSLAGLYYSQAVASYRRVYNVTGILPVELSVAEMADRQGDHEGARATTAHLLRLASQLGMEAQAARARMLLAHIHLSAGRPDSARYYGEQSLVASGRNGLRPEARDAAQVLAQASARLGSWGAAYTYQVLASRYADTLTGEATRRQIAGLQNIASRHRQQAQLRLLQQQARLQTQQQELARLRYHQRVVALAGLAGLILVLSAGFLWRYRQREARRQQALRTRIAADLHDEVGSMLTQISMQSTLLREGRYAPAQQQLYLDQMAEASRRAARQMNDAVWSIDARYDSAASLLDRLRDHAHEVLPPAGLEVDFGAEAAVASAAVPLATRQALYYIYKEALHNVVKHACARQVRVRVRLLGRQLELKIRDDGQGTVAASRPGGQGLPNMRMRAQAVGGTLQLDTTGPGLGLVVRLPLR